MRPLVLVLVKDYFFTVRRSRFSNRRASSPNNSVCVARGKMAFAICVINFSAFLVFLQCFRVFYLARS